MKISTWHKRRGNKVDFVRSKILSKKKHDKLYITTLFTYFAKEVIETINFYKNFDTIKAIESNRRVPSEDYKPPTKEKIGACEKCGGELKDDLNPMCPKCKSRDVKAKEILLMYD